MNPEIDDVELEEVENEIENVVDDDASETNPLKDIISAIGEEDYSSASDMFASEINSRLSTAIDQSRINVASKIYSNEKEEIADAEV
jgi:hypothetical protein